jgi:AraC-like DNA-binding protein
MKYWYQRPHEFISKYVRTVLILEGFSQSPSSDLPLVTNGMPALFCCTEKDPAGGERVTRLTLFGKSLPSECWEIGPDKTIIVFFFMPFAMAGIFNIPAAKLLDAPVELNHWVPHKTNALRTQLTYAESTLQKTEGLEHFVIHQLQENNRVCEIIRSATDEIMKQPDTTILSTLLQGLDLNKRTFQRIFKKYVGVSPGQYRRICQFQLSFAQVRAKEFNTLTDVAFDNGFADQSHFIRSFKEFADITPNDYLRSGLKEKS